MDESQGNRETGLNASWGRASGGARTGNGPRRAEAISVGSRETLRPGGPAVGRIDQYELMRELGGGGFGVVYLALDTVAGTEVAVKGLPPLVKNNADELAQIRENFALVSKLYHPRIAAALHLHPAKEVYYADASARQALRVLPGDTMMVMAYAPGVTVAKWRKQFPGGRVPVDQALEVCRQIAEALDYAHGEKVVHRDVKPSNVMVESRGPGWGGSEVHGSTAGETPDAEVAVRVLDFGLAAEIRSSMGRVSQERGDTSGTRPYMAPEQWAGKRQDGRTDQYALAVLFYELVSGTVPFASAFDTGDPVIMANAAENKPPEPLDRLSKGQNAALLRALSKKPEERFASCRAFVEAVAGTCAEARGRGVKRAACWLAGAAVLAAVSALSVTSLRARHARVAEAREAAERASLREAALRVSVAREKKAAADERGARLLHAEEQRRAAEKAKQAADASGAAADAKALYDAGVLACVNAAAVFEKGGFEAAAGAWQEAAGAFASAQTLAAAVQDYRQAKQAFEAALGGPDSESSVLLAEHGGAKWAAAQKQRKIGEESASDPAAGQRAYVAARAALAGALEEALALKAGAAKSVPLPPPGPPQEKEAGLVEGKPWASPATGMEFVWVPSLNLWAGKYEVTNGDYRKKVPKHNSMTYKGQNLNSDRQPAVYVNFDDAAAYAAWLTEQDKAALNGWRYRVPTESEWQAFAQCGSVRDFPWGDASSPAYGNYADQTAKRSFSDWTVLRSYNDGFAATCPVERSGENEWGLFGVGGNVWECCASDLNGALFKSWRGASWFDYGPNILQCSYRFDRVGSFRFVYLGFRLVLAQPPKKADADVLKPVAGTEARKDVSRHEESKAKVVPPAGFVALFNGKDLANWKGVTRTENFDSPIVRQRATPQKRAEMQAVADKEMYASWHVDDHGVLCFDGTGYNIATVMEYCDFELYVDWRLLKERGDSGIYLRGSPQVQIWDAHNQWGKGSGGLFNNKKNPSIALAIADRPIGEWNTFFIRMVGEKVTVKLNGVLVVNNTVFENYWDRSSSIFPKGQIELQCHGDPIEFRNIYIREL